MKYRIWFYVPDYPKVKSELESMYQKFGVDEWSAEPGEVRGRPNDADVIVDGEEKKIADFWNWLVDSKIQGLQVEGREITR